MIYDVGDSSLRKPSNRQNIVLILGGGQTDDIINSVSELEKKFRISFTNSKSKSFLTIH